MSLKPPFHLPLTPTLLTLVLGLVTYSNLVTLHLKVYLIDGFLV